MRKLKAPVCLVLLSKKKSQYKTDGELFPKFDEENESTESVQRLLVGKHSKCVGGREAVYLLEVL